MKVVKICDDKSLIWSEEPTPVISEGEALVRIRAFGVNRADLMQRAGQYPPPPGCPDWMGLEIAGEIEEIKGESYGFEKGSRVCALLGGGGYAEYAVVKNDMLMPVPEGFSFAEGAAIPETYATAYLNLVYEGGLQKGETYLVFAGASGVGIASTQIAKSMGAKVIATVRSDEKAAACVRIGADRAVNTKKEDIVEVFREEGVDLVIDCVGGSDAGKCFGEMNRYGRWVSIATLAGPMTEINMQSVYKKGLRLIGSTLRSRTPEKKAEICRNLVRDVFPFFEKGDFKPEIYRVFKASEVEEAHAAMQANQNIGKIIVEL